MSGSTSNIFEGAPSEELLRLIFDSARDFAIFVIDPNGLVTSWNPGAERLLGYGKSEILGCSADVLFPPEEGGGEAGEDERRRALADGRAEDERWQMRKDGTRFFASGLMMPLADRSAGFVKMLRDRTAQHRAETQIKQSEERFRLLATHIPQLVFRSGPDGERTWGSPQWCVFTGLTFADSVDFGWLDAVHPDDREATLSAWPDARKQGEYYIEHRIRRSSDGEYRWHQTRAAPLETGSAPSEWVGTSTDIHDLRMLQQRQGVLVDELQHRTRNLLSVVQWMARRSLRSANSPEAFANDFESRLRALGRAQGLLARNREEIIGVRDLVEAELSALGGAQNLRGKVTIEGPKAALAPRAAQTLALALHELATNAVKYGALGRQEGRLTVRWSVDEQAPPPRARLQWLEEGVEIAGTPARTGYGTELIERALPYQLGTKTELAFTPNGVRCEIELPLAANA